MAIIVKLETDVWLRDGDGGHPYRTLVVENATRYRNLDVAVSRLIVARKYRPYPRAELQEAAEAEGDEA